ncbi:hypothetical protein Scep_022328 [Stephania cephalantha]|uniref:Uncharacterized protein n=1 Tax=Stephania cephalantha TaxID=152367 RepID=A0AAP0F5Y7_9MAGN
MDREQLQELRERYGWMEQALTKRLGLNFVGGTSSLPTIVAPPVDPHIAHTHDESDDNLGTDNDDADDYN